MPLTRAALREMGVAEKEIIDAIMEAHGETIETTKAKYQVKIDGLQDQLNAKPKVKEPAGDGEDWKAKYDALAASAVDESGKSYKELHDALKGEYDTYKTNIETEKTAAATDSKVAAHLDSAGMHKSVIDKALKLYDRSIVEFDKNGNIKNGDKVTELFKADWEGFFGTTTTQGADPATPPVGQDTKTDPFIAGFDT